MNYSYEAYTLAIQKPAWLMTTADHAVVNLWHGIFGIIALVLFFFVLFVIAGISTLAEEYSRKKKRGSK